MSKEKFYRHNRDVFLRYFDSLEQYNALIIAGNFKKMEAIIKEGSNFNLDAFQKEIEQWREERAVSND